MCTVSILPFESGEYQLLMNRDESPLRPAALELRRGHSEAGLEHAAPIDLRSGGTWVGLNARGVSFALMNQHPQGYFKREGLRSRGELIPRLINALSAHEAASRMSQVDLEPYPPFFLLTLDGRSSILALSWDGSQRQVHEYPREPRLFASSSFETEEVLLGRQEQFEGLLARVKAAPDHEAALAVQRDFHRSHLPSRGPYSICLHRDDAQSVSLTEISVRGLGCRLRYHAGPPCVPALELEAVLA
jgi:hypothetical protein